MIDKYERGETAPSVYAAKKIADAFEVFLDYLACSTCQQSNETLTKTMLITPKQKSIAPLIYDDI